MTMANNKIAYKKLYNAIPNLQFFKSTDTPEQILQDCLIRNFKLIKIYSTSSASVQQINITQFRKQIIPKNIEQLGKQIKTRELELKQKNLRFSKGKYKINFHVINNKRQDNHRKQISSLNKYTSFTKDSISNSLVNDSDKQNLCQNSDENESLNNIKSERIQFSEKNQKQLQKTEATTKQASPTSHKKIQHFDIVKEGNDWVLASINNYNDTFLQTRNKKRSNLLSCSEMRQKMMKTTKMKNFFSQTKKLRMSHSSKIQLNNLKQKKSQKYFIKDHFQIRLSQNQQVIISMPIPLRQHRKQNSLQICHNPNIQNSFRTIRKYSNLIPAVQNSQDLIKISCPLQLGKINNCSIETKQDNNNLLTFRKRKELRNLTQRLVSFPLVK